jgi:hypothetical protein
MEARVDEEVRVLVLEHGSLCRSMYHEVVEQDQEFELRM